MERKIIVGYDGSPAARDALVLGGLLGELTGRPLLLAGFFDDDPVRYARAEGDGELHAYPDAHLVLEQAPVGAEIERRVIHGRSPASALSMLAEERDAAAIVVGSTHHPGQGFAISGGIARQLFGNSPCSVAAAPRGYRERAPERLGRLLAAYVETDEGLEALRIAGELAEAGRATLRVVSVLDTDSASLMRGRPSGDSRRAARERELGTATDARAMLAGDAGTRALPDVEPEQAAGSSLSATPFSAGSAVGTTQPIRGAARMQTRPPMKIISRHTSKRRTCDPCSRRSFGRPMGRTPPIWRWRMLRHSRRTLTASS